MMPLTKFIAMPAWLIFAAVIAAIACEETLDPCAPCGSIAAGDFTISGNPSLDGTFRAVQQVRYAANEAQARFDDDFLGLAQAFNVGEEASAEELKEAIKAQLFGDSRFVTSITIAMPQCWVDDAQAVSIEHSCGERLDCRGAVQDGEETRAPLCIGFFSGQCPSPATCEGECLVATDLSGTRCSDLDLCVGSCDGETGLNCSGYCFGGCLGKCLVRDYSGDCAGYCDGLCGGICESADPFSCDGLCLGFCRDQGFTTGQCAGECRGICKSESGAGAGTGQCRGHLYPAVYNHTCLDCQETARLVAWASLACSPAQVSVRLDFGGSLPPDKQALIAKGRLLEQVLARVADDYAKFVLLVDGIDVLGELSGDELSLMTDDGFYWLQFIDQSDESNLSYLKNDKEALDNYGVVYSKRFYPLSSLKARLGMLGERALSGDFIIAFGAIPCIEQALPEAKAIVDRLIPSRTEGDAGLVEDRLCVSDEDAEGVPKEETEIPCLYRLIDDQAALLELAERILPITVQ